MSVISITGLTHFYNKGTPFESVAIHDINLEIQKGELLAIIGHTGSGKSTLIQHFNGLLKPDKGVVKFNGSDIWENKKHIREVRFNVGLCFQYPEYQLFEETVAKDVAFGPLNLGLSQEEIDSRVKEALELVGFNYDKIKDLSPFDLSGGQKRRVAIAGVLAMKPDYLILDEPTAGLDPAGRNELFAQIKKLHEKGNLTVVLVSHSMEDIARLVNKVIVLYKGKIHMKGIPKEIYSQSEELKRIGLGVPQIAEIVLELNKRGFNIKNDIINVEEATVEILKEIRRRKNV